MTTITRLKQLRDQVAGKLKPQRVQKASSAEAAAKLSAKNLKKAIKLACAESNNFLFYEQQHVSGMDNLAEAIRDNFNMLQSPLTQHQYYAAGIDTSESN